MSLSLSLSIWDSSPKSNLPKTAAVSRSFSSRTTFSRTKEALLPRSLAPRDRVLFSPLVVVRSETRANVARRGLREDCSPTSSNVLRKPREGTSHTVSYVDRRVDPRVDGHVNRFKPDQRNPPTIAHTRQRKRTRRRQSPIAPVAICTRMLRYSDVECAFLCAR